MLYFASGGQHNGRSSVGRRQLAVGSIVDIRLRVTDSCLLPTSRRRSSAASGGATILVPDLRPLAPDSHASHRHRRYRLYGHDSLPLVPQGAGGEGLGALRERGEAAGGGLAGDQGELRSRGHDDGSLGDRDVPRAGRDARRSADRCRRYLPAAGAPCRRGDCRASGGKTCLL